MKHCLLVFAAVVALAVGVPASAQYMFVDVDGDGDCDNSDVLTTGTTSFDVWLKTNVNKNGTTAICSSGEALTINSYTFILSAPGGGVTYGVWTDNMGFTINANVFPDGTGRGGNDVWVAKASGVILPPGVYKLGSLAVTVATANATVEFHEASSIDATAMTSFGSQCSPPPDFNNTMILGLQWTDICGTASATPATETTWGKIKNLYR